MAHPYASQVNASTKRRLSALGAKAGKSWGHSAMQTSSSYPTTHAGTERPKTIAGGTAGIQASGKVARKRADRYARGGKVKKSGSTTNIIIADSGRGSAQPSPVPVPVPVGGAPPIPSGPPPMARSAPPIPPPGPRPVMKSGGGVGRFGDGSEYHNWGKGYRRGGGVAKLQPTEEPPPGKTYSGYPHSPTKDVDDAISPTKRGGVVKKKKFGGRAGSGTGYSRIKRNHEAAKVPAKTEI